MNTAMSTKRSFIPVGNEAKSGNSLGILALVGGFLLLAAGIALSEPWIAVIGFLPFTTSALYFNGLFWAKILDSKKMRMPSRESIAKYY